MAKKQEYYRAEDLAQKIDVNIMTIYRYIKAGRLVAHKIGKEYRIDRTEFERFMTKTKTK
jgi:excisionase family DNA binding protein